MSVRVQLNEDTSSYELGDDIDGAFIPFVQVPRETVDGRIAAVKEAAAAAGASASTTSGKVTGNTGDDFTAADFTDNGDGTFTRNADQVQGRFTPSGFEPVTTP